jgi:hypothetical protein
LSSLLVILASALTCHPDRAKQRGISAIAAPTSIRLTIYTHGNHIYEMAAGDSLTFDGEIPHGPETLVEVPIKLLSMINYSGAG